MRTIRTIVISVAIVLMQYSATLYAQVWIEGDLLERELLGFKSYSFDVKPDDIKDIGFICDELWPTSDALRCKSTERSQETFLGNPVKLQIDFDDQGVMYAIFIDTELSPQRVDKALYDAFGSPFFSAYEVEPAFDGAPSKIEENIWVFANGAIVDFSRIGARVLWLRYVNPKKVLGYRKGLFLKFPALHKFLPAIDKSDL